MPQRSITIDQCNIDKIKDNKFVGLDLYNNLTLDAQVQSTTKQISSGLYSLKRMSHLCNLNTLGSTNFANMHSYFSYSLAIYGETSKTNLEKILGFQKQDLKVSLNNSTLSSHKNTFNS